MFAWMVKRHHYAAHYALSDKGRRETRDMKMFGEPAEEIVSIAAVPGSLLVLCSEACSEPGC